MWAHPRPVQRLALLRTGGSSAAPVGCGAGSGLRGWRGAAQPKGLQAPSALTQLLIAVYTSGYNLEIALPESIKGLASNLGASPG